MPRTPPRTHPARPLTVSVCVRHGKSKENQSQQRIASLASTRSVDVCRPRSTPTNSNDASGSVRGGAAWACRTVGAMGPRHAPGGLGRTLNPGLAACAGQRTRARRHRAPRDGFTACPASPYRPAKPNIPTAAVDVDFDFASSGARAAGPGNKPLPVVVQGATRQEHPGAGDLQDVDLVLGLRQRREWLRKLHHPQRRLIQQRRPA